MLFSNCLHYRKQWRLMTRLPTNIFPKGLGFPTLKMWIIPAELGNSIQYFMHVTIKQSFLPFFPFPTTHYSYLITVILSGQMLYVTINSGTKSKHMKWRVCMCVHSGVQYWLKQHWPRRWVPEHQTNENSTSLLWFCSTRPSTLCKRSRSDCTSHTHTHPLSSSPQALCCGGNSADSDIIIPRPLSNITEEAGNVVQGNE